MTAHVHMQICASLSTSVYSHACRSLTDCNFLIQRKPNNENCAFVMKLVWYLMYLINFLVNSDCLSMIVLASSRLWVLYIPRHWEDLNTRSFT